MVGFILTVNGGGSFLTIPMYQKTRLQDILQEISQIPTEAGFGPTSLEMVSWNLALSTTP